MEDEGLLVRFRRTIGLLAGKANIRRERETIDAVAPSDQGGHLPFNPLPGVITRNRIESTSSLQGSAPVFQLTEKWGQRKPAECIIEVKWELPRDNLLFGANLPTEAEPAIGLIEFSSVAVGMKVCDQMLKNAPVTLLEAATICPGRFVTIMHGDAVAVEYAMTNGRSLGGVFILDSLYIADISPQVLAAFSELPGEVDYDSLGIIETSSVAATIVAADVMTKQTDVHLLRIKLAKELGGKAYAIVGGVLGEVEVCLQAATDAIASPRKVIQVTIIPVPDQALLRKLNLPLPNQYRTQNEIKLERKEVGLRYGTHA